MTDHRARVLAAVEKWLARRSPSGFWPIDARFPWAMVAGCSLHCARCGATPKAPLPRAEGYGAAVEAFLRAHRACPDRQEARP